MGRSDREESLIHRIAFIRANQGSCPASSTCPIQCLTLEHRAWDKRFYCWRQHYRRLADKPFHTQDTGESFASCGDCKHMNTVACKTCGWEKESWEERYE
jgi:hypothetical protein